MKKKIAAIMLMTAMLTMLLGGCKNSASESEKGKETNTQGNSSVETTGAAEDETEGKLEGDISMLWWGNQVRNERTQQILEMFMDENKGVTVDGQFADGGDYWTRLATLTAGQTMPDIIQMTYAFITQYAENNSLVDLTPYIEDGTIDVSNVSENILETGKVGGKIYGICNGVNAPALLYNKTLLDKAGIEVKDNMTMDEFEELCREVYEKTGYKTGLAYGSNLAPTQLQYLLRAYDEHLFKDGKFGVDSADAFLEYFKLYEDGIKEGWHVDPGVYVERTIGSVEQDCMVYGSSPKTMSWCAFYHSNQVTAMQNAAPENVEIGITSWPSANPGKSNFLNPSQFFCVSADSGHPEIGAALINYITNSVECNNVLLGERGVPVSSVVASEISANQSETDQKVVAYINNVVTPNSSTIDEAEPANASEVFSLVNELTEKVLYGEIAAEDAAGQLYEQGTVILETR